MSHRTTPLKGEFGTRVIGKCYLPFRVHDCVDEGYDLQFNLRSNFGGVKRSVGFGIALTYRKRDRQWLLKLKSNDLLAASMFPLFKVPAETSITDLSMYRQVSLVKPNKHFLKRHHLSVTCRQGVLRIPILFTAEGDVVLRGALLVYPAVLNGKEFLMIAAEGVPIIIGQHS